MRSPFDLAPQTPAILGQLRNGAFAGAPPAPAMPQQPQPQSGGGLGGMGGIAGLLPLLAAAGGGGGSGVSPQGFLTGRNIDWVKSLFTSLPGSATTPGLGNYSMPAQNLLGGGSLIGPGGLLGGGV